jgi:hypothetical protein
MQEMGREKEKKKEVEIINFLSYFSILFPDKIIL